MRGLSKWVGLLLLISLLLGGVTAYGADSGASNGTLQKQGLDSEACCRGHSTPEAEKTEDAKEEKKEEAATVSAPPLTVKEQLGTARMLGIIPEEMEGNYGKAITKEEFCKLAIKALTGMCGIDQKDISSKFKARSFKDANSEEVYTAYILGLVDGETDVRFSPKSTLTRQQGARLLKNVLNTINADLYTAPR